MTRHAKKDFFDNKLKKYTCVGNGLDRSEVESRLDPTRVFNFYPQLLTLNYNTMKKPPRNYYYE